MLVPVRFVVGCRLLTLSLLWENFEMIHLGVARLSIVDWYHRVPIHDSRRCSLFLFQVQRQRMTYDMRRIVLPLPDKEELYKIQISI